MRRPTRRDVLPLVAALALVQPHAARPAAAAQHDHSQHQQAPPAAKEKPQEGHQLRRQRYPGQGLEALDVRRRRGPVAGQLIVFAVQFLEGLVVRVDAVLQGVHAQIRSVGAKAAP